MFKHGCMISMNKLKVISTITIGYLYTLMDFFIVFHKRWI